ncbi:uncharacterized protein [Coffea arabica]|uniref:5'-deoxynucleotidase n=1 Tax=Coffea arabica TaxID=13443 RepID=A0A6P6SI63_COFAR|nr:HD domain-containing protein 2-like isoform X2 [Coffea arabica]
MSRAIFKSTLLVGISCSTQLRFTINGASFRACRKSPSSSSSSRVSSMATSERSDAAAASSPSSSSPASRSSASAIDFLTLCHRLKTTKRAGWVKKGVENPESIADHMYRMGVMALIAADIPGVNRDKCIKMAIVHDIAEDGISKLEKSQREQEALEHMCKLLGGGPQAKEIADLWTEYEENTSLEAKVVKDLDKVEMILQALEYENEQGKDLDEFFQSTAGKFQTNIGKAWASEIASRRRNH